MLPTGDLQDEQDDSGILEIVYPGGHSIEVIGQMFLEMAVAEGAQIEVATSPEELGIKGRHLTPAQKRGAEMMEHLQLKHRLD